VKFRFARPYWNETVSHPNHLVESTLRAEWTTCVRSGSTPIMLPLVVLALWEFGSSSYYDAMKADEKVTFAYWEAQGTNWTRLDIDRRMDTIDTHFQIATRGLDELRRDKERWQLLQAQGTNWTSSVSAAVAAGHAPDWNDPILKKVRELEESAEGMPRNAISFQLRTAQECDRNNRAQFSIFHEAQLVQQHVALGRQPIL
jgi:hypothetical protein